MNALVQILGWALVHALWQGCLLVLLAALCGRFLQDRARHRVDGLALALCLLLPTATAWHFHRPVPTDFSTAQVSWMEAGSAISSLSSPRSIPVPYLARLEASLQPQLPVLVALWALGAGLMALRMGGGYALSLRWKRRAVPAPGQWQGVVDALAGQMGILRPVRVLLSREGRTPMTLGLWKPVVLIPAALLTSLPPDYLEALLAHELAHVRRLDYLSNLLQGIAETLLFFHPAVWWLSARIRAEREVLADQGAARSLGDARRLALALNALDDAQFSFPQPLFPALAARGGPLLTRIERLLSPRPPARAHWGMLSLLFVPFAVLVLRATSPEPPPIGAPAQLLAQLDALAAREGLDPQLLRSVAWVESGFNAKARSPRGARGLLQVMPETARAHGAMDLDDPAQVTAAGAKYLRFLLDRYQGDVPKAVAAYNCGEKALDEGRLTEEASRYRALVLDVLAAKAVQPEAPLADGEVQGVLRRNGDRLSIQARIRTQGNLRLRYIPDDKDGNAGEVNIGERLSEKGHPGEAKLHIRSWMDSRPNIILDLSKVSTSLLVVAEDPGTGWKGEARVLLDAPWKTFAFRMEPPKP